MAMSASGMANLIVAQLQPTDAAITGDAQTKLINYWTLICTGIIAHITADAAVSVTGVTQSGPPTGPFPFVAQPGTIS